MKKLLILIPVTCMLITMQTQAQFKKGTVMLGTNIGTTAFSSANSDYFYEDGATKSTGTHTYTLSMGPQAGEFITPRLVVGGTLAFNLSTSRTNSNTVNANNTSSGSTTNTTTSTVSIGPYFRYYFAGFPSRTWYYLQANAAVGTGSGNSSGTSYSNTATANTDGKVSDIFNWNTGASIGLTHFFYKHIGMDVALGYSYNHAHNYNTNNTNTTNKITGNLVTSTNDYTLNTATNGVNFGVGFHWFL